MSFWAGKIGREKQQKHKAKEACFFLKIEFNNSNDRKKTEKVRNNTQQCLFLSNAECLYGLKELQCKVS
jgi:hypothetical protein